MKVKLFGRRLALVFVDALIIMLSTMGVLIIDSLRSAGGVGITRILVNCAVQVMVVFACRFAFRLYSIVWRYANPQAYLLLIISDVLSCAISMLLLRFTPYYVGALQGVAINALGAFLVLASRMIYQQIYSRLQPGSQDMSKINIAIVGAGMVGSLLAQELIYNEKSQYKPIFFIDKDPTKVGNYVHGIKVLPENDETAEHIKHLPIQEVLIALPNISADDLQRLFKRYGKSNCRVKVYDSYGSKGNGHAKAIRNINIEDLLYRDNVTLYNRKTMDTYRDKVVLVTGGGGSIGSEICRQIAALHPRQLIIFDIYENNAYDIQQELVRKYGANLNLAVEIGSVRDKVRLETIFDEYRPQIVLHAAAHKHVPLMEHSSCEAIKNNVVGTYNTANMAEKYGADRFVLISTDKAVNPTNIMGASKRVCEMIVNCRGDSNTVFSAVRFGNVLGSNGSVVPLFMKQIEEGGPITITDRRIVRFFMTIKEATQLVMEAGSIANQGDLFVLDMGKPICILDLAEDMIRLAGLKPYEDIDIMEIGLRPGEKLYEELLANGQDQFATSNNKIFIEKKESFTRAQVDEYIEMLLEAVANEEQGAGSISVKDVLRKVVTTYRDPEEVNRNTDVYEMKCAEEKHQEISAREQSVVKV